MKPYLSLPPSRQAMLLMLGALLSAHAGAESSLSASVDVMTRQTASGASSRLQASIEARHDTAIGSFFLQDGEAGWAIPAPAGWVSLSLANEPIWSLGSSSSHNMALARYGVDLPNNGSLSVGLAKRVGNTAPGKMMVLNLEWPLTTWHGQKIELLGWASEADTQRRYSLGHEVANSHWQLEQANLMLVASHPLNREWSLDAGAGSRWAAEARGSHQAGWQTLLGVTWQMP